MDPSKYNMPYTMVIIWLIIWIIIMPYNMDFTMVNNQLWILHQTYFKKNCI